MNERVDLNYGHIRFHERVDKENEKCFIEYGVSLKNKKTRTARR